MGDTWREGDEIYVFLLIQDIFFQSELSWDCHAVSFSSICDLSIEYYRVKMFKFFLPHKLEVMKLMVKFLDCSIIITKDGFFVY